jgi:amidase
MLTIAGIARDLRSGRSSATALVDGLVTDLLRRKATIGGVAAVDPARSRAEAAAADRRLRDGTARPLEGIPFTVKDWIDVAGWPVLGATGGQAGNPDRRPEHDAPAVARLRAAGAIVIAISSAMADNAAHGPTRNPHDPTRAPGGSSSGAAALVAAGTGPFALGSDSGGSIRLPAAWCGVAGLKPTFGRVPLSGHYPRCGALEDGRTVIGPLASTVEDLATVLKVIAGPDGMDAGAPPMPLGDPDTVGVPELRVGVMAGTSSDEPTTRAVEALARAGATIADERLPDVCGEALELTRRHWGRAKLTGAQHARLLWDWDRFRRRQLIAMAGIDVLVTPATKEPAPPWRESAEADYHWTLPWSLTGAPVAVVPVGTRHGLPVAVQIVARPWHDHVTLAAARRVEEYLRDAAPPVAARG